MEIGLALLGIVLAASGGADLGTPRAAMRAFIEDARSGDHSAASRVLDLRRAPEDVAPEELARRLKFVLDQQLWIDFDQISDDPAGNAADGVNRETIGTIALRDTQVPVRLARESGQWRIAPETVAWIPALWQAYGAPWIADVLPPYLQRIRFLEVAGWQWLGLLVAILAAALVGLLANAALSRVLIVLARRTAATWDDLLIQTCRAPVRFLLALVAFDLLIAPLHLAAPPEQAIDVMRRTLLLVGLTWLLLRALSFAAATLEARFAGPEVEAGVARGVRTQVRLLHRVAQVITAVVAGALLLLQFEVVRSVGVSLLASAGVAGIVLGLAAQRTIGSVLAGIQLSVTQPVRIGDTVIVEGEWGTIEEIHLTYAVVNIWDQRRLIVPVTHFLERPFQNWTKVAPQLLGTVEIHADYSVPVARVRAELERQLQGNPLWDGRAWGLQVTNATERTVTLRALVSAANAGHAWDLRCEVREKLIAFLQDLEAGRYLPRVRVESDGAASLAERGAA